MDGFVLGGGGVFLWCGMGRVFGLWVRYVVCLGLLSWVVVG